MLEVMRDLRKKRGATLKDVAAAVGVAESTISLYERGERAPSYEVLLKLGEYFDVSADYLLNGGPSQRDIVFAATPDPEWTDLEKKVDNGTATEEEVERFRALLIQSLEKSHSVNAQLLEKASGYLEKLSAQGQAVALERLKELSEVPKYRKLTDEEMRKLYPQDKRMLIGGPDGPEWIPGQE